MASLRSPIIVLSVWLMLMGMIACSPNSSPPSSLPRKSPVYILDTEGLEPPAMGVDPARKPGYSIGGADDEMPDGGVVAFELTLAARGADALQMRLAESAPGQTIPLDSFAVSASLPPAIDLDWNRLPLEVRNVLNEGRGLFARVEKHTKLSSEQIRIAVLLPTSTMTPETRLEVYTDTFGDGSPFGAAKIPLVRDFYYIAVLGDSIQWGNGLTDRHKFSALVAQTIEREKNVKVIRQIRAHSGARIVPIDEDVICSQNCWGEAPVVATSIRLQAKTIESPDLIDLVMMDGCINDVDVLSIINPNITPDDLALKTRTFCYEEMRALLEEVRETVPQAPVVVTAYFPIISKDNDLDGLEQYMALNEVPQDNSLSEIIERMVENSAVFDDVSRASLAQAVHEANEKASGDRMIAFAPTEFKTEHSLFASASYLWGMDENNAFLNDLEIDLALFPEDPVLEQRADFCLQNETIDSFLGCVYASVGHPNIDGARAYATAIEKQLIALGVLDGDGGSE